LTHVWYYIFFVGSFLIFFNYAGYVIPIWLLHRLRRRTAPITAATTPLPGLTMIIAAYNEASCIAEKISNSLSQSYPAETLEILVVTDGSTDQTPDIAARYPGVRVLHQTQRRGKAAAINRAVLLAQNDILVFTDANTILNTEALVRIAAHFSRPETGGVAGEKKVIAPAEGDSLAGEGLYWKYESFLKKMDSALYSVVGAAGELWAVRKELYTQLPENTILDDFVLSLRAAAKGFRIIYEPEAYAMELPSFSLEDERKRKIRIAAGGFQSMIWLKDLLLIWRHPRLTYLYVSHRVLRWTLSPLSLILVLLSNAMIVLTDGNTLFRITLAFQLAFYVLAALSGQPRMPAKLSKLCKLAYYFTFMNVSVILGFFRWLKGSQSAAWEKARRAEGNMLIR
jgi:poly-beta-1,6-N-acetyl-D-glucosamine synthase